MTVFNEFAEIVGNKYQVNVKTQGWTLANYTIHLSVSEEATCGLSLVQKGQAKGKDK